MIYFAISIPFALLSLHQIYMNLRYNPSFFVYIFFVLWFFVTSYFSVSFLVLKDVYISELGEYSSSNSAPLVISVLWLFSVLLMCRKLRFRVFNFSPRRLEYNLSLKFVLVFVLLSLLALMFNLMMSEVPLWGGISRFDYWGQSKMPWLSKILGETSAVIAFCCGLLYAFAKSSYSRFSIILFVSYLVYLILIGNKFSALFTAILTFLIPFFVSKSRFVFSFRFVSITLLSVILAFFLVYYYYETFGNDYSKLLGLSIVEAIFYRLMALQGQLFWSSISDAGILHGAWDLSFILNPMQSLMYHHLGDAARDAVERGVNLTNAFPAYLFRTVGILGGMFFSFLYLIPIWITGSALISALRSRRFFVSVIIWQSYQWTTYGVVMGYLGSIAKGLVLFVMIITICSLFKLISKHAFLVKPKPLPIDL